MGRSNNYGLPPAVEDTCPKCKSHLTIFQRWVASPAKQPPACPICGEQFLELDEGKRVDAQTKREYKQSYATEYYDIKVLRRGPARPVKTAES